MDGADELSRLLYLLFHRDGFPCAEATEAIRVFACGEFKRGQENMRNRATQRAQAQREFVRGERGDFYPGDIAGLPILDPEAA